MMVRISGKKIIFLFHGEMRNYGVHYYDPLRKFNENEEQMFRYDNLLSLQSSPPNPGLH